ncbi:glycoside hydrolase family 5 protein [Fibrobacter succinogenes]|uniref:glycoside hydrolase family 5 protein n=1 Tax=Fibrobacter succinogenes TaxID=833 RepID=UPI0026EA105A|nr:glycoside hydrolase family 5 protein [Fibrobacter succinogenes]
MVQSKFFGIACGVAMLAGAVSAATLPTAKDVQAKMGMGFNIGNSMEVPNNPTLWGNPYPTQALLDSVKAAGFNTVRIPCAWDSHTSGGKVTETWLDSVKTVVDYAMRAGLYTILNIHHEGEGGWFQSNIGTSVDNTIDNKMKTYWTQIANKFKNYNERLLFAGANEPGPNVNTWTAQHVQTLMHYYQTFIDAVRATGGNNETRTLIIQGLNTDIDKSVKSAPVSTFPKDKVEGRLMFEVHYYDPYQYTLMTSQQDWGASEPIQPQYYYGDYTKASEPKRNAGYNAWGGAVDSKLGSIVHPQEQFAKMKTNYVDKGYPVIVGEFGANVRSPELSGSDLNLHKQGRVQWHKDVVSAAKQYGLTPILWDMGNESNTGYDNMAYIRRQSSPVGKVLETDVINAMRSVYNLGNYVNNGVTHVEDFIGGGTETQSSSSNGAESKSSSSGTTPQSSSSVEKNCDAMMPECGWSPEELCKAGFAEYCDGTALPTVLAGVQENLRREGNMLYGSGSIMLFDMNGNLVRSTNNVSAGQAQMQLHGLRQGNYIAKCKNSVLQVKIR